MLNNFQLKFLKDAIKIRMNFVFKVVKKRKENHAVFQFQSILS